MSRNPPVPVVPEASGRPPAGPAILRDGTTTFIRPAQPADEAALQDFFSHLSPAARQFRFFSQAPPSRQEIASLCDRAQPHTKQTLLASRFIDDGLHIIGVGSYAARDTRTAEVSFAVADEFQAKGLGTLLLEAIAMLAVRHGFVRLWAVMQADNVAMREVFQGSGYEISERLGNGHMEVELSALPTPFSVERKDVRDRIATVASLRPFFHPRSIAVIGVSRDPAHIGYRLLETLLDSRFQGDIYPVNPSAVEIQGLRVWPSLRDIPGPVDLAIIAVPAAAVMTVVHDCTAKEVRALVVITAGFAETGAAGRALQDQLVAHVRQAGMRMVGPNCFGLVNTDPFVRLNATFGAAFPPHGRVAMSSQSGALGLAILSTARRLHLGISSFVSIGNTADISGNDLLQYWEHDSETDVILLYLESFGNPRRFAKLARRVAQRKPIVALKAGRSRAGRRAADSHTAALAASERAVDALFHQAGVIRARTLDEMFALGTALATQPLPRGRRVGIITNAGGPAILCADACEDQGLTVPELSANVNAALRAFLPPTAGVKNPVDLIASATPDQYRRAVATLMDSDEVDAVIAIYVSISSTDTSEMARGLCDGLLTRPTGPGQAKPVIACWISEYDRGGRDVLQQARVPTYALPEMPPIVLGKMAAYAEWLALPPGRTPEFPNMDLAQCRSLCRTALARDGAGWLSADDARRMLLAAGLPIPAGGVAASAQQAMKLARNLGFPVAAKLASRRFVHKTEIGGVRLNLQTETEVRQTFEEFHQRLAQTHQEAAMEGMIVQPMISGGVEVMVGVTQDPLFGPLIAFGLGGIHVEILGDVQFRIGPLTDREASEMIRGIKGFRLLEGYRGHAAADIPALEEVLLRISRLVEEIPEISEMDLNPIFAFAPGQGCRIADARIHVAPLDSSRPQIR
ncbi:MAG: GNAT family N-acetyltransferase [Nitrospira sp.]|nr:MAG: GNAT family N-acetyltransferase [Nitrospira sp.]